MVLLLLLLAFLINFSSVLFLQIFGLDDFVFHETSYPLLYAFNNLNNFSLMSPTFLGRETAPFGVSLIYTFLLLIGMDLNYFTHLVGLLIYDLLILLLILSFKFLHLLSIRSTLLLGNFIFLYFNVDVTTYAWKDQVWIWPMNSTGGSNSIHICCIKIF